MSLSTIPTNIWKWIIIQ